MRNASASMVVLWLIVLATQRLGTAGVGGEQWQGPRPLEGTYGHYIWRAAAHGGRAYLCGRRNSAHAQVRGEPESMQSAMLESEDGLLWRFRALFQETHGDETAFQLLEGGEILGISRRGRQPAELIRSQPPYTRWTRQDLSVGIGGPLLARWGDHWLVGGRRNTPDGPRTTLYWLADDQLQPFAELPSDGDNSYPGFVDTSARRGVVSWYSSHENDADGQEITAIYLADLEIAESLDVEAQVQQHQRCDTSEAPRPNIVILLADDMGYGDPGCYGHPLVRTPRLDALAAEGLRLTSFVTGCWCVPSRTQLLTGRYMPRVPFGGGTGSDGKGGLPEQEWTLAEALRDAGYRTHMIGKWHLGYKEKKFLPVHQGFDTWFGLPYSNDYIKPWVQTNEPLGLYRGDEMVEHPFDQNSLTVRYTEAAVELIEKCDSKHPFLIYVAYAMPHLPLAVSDARRGSSEAGLYGDVIEELDWSVGEVLSALERRGIVDETLVVFASDNGPWIEMPPRMQQAGNELWHAGSPGPLRGSKGQTYEGGARVPAIVRWPGQIAAGRVSAELVGMPDIYRTLLALAAARLPEHALDGYDLTPFLTGQVDAAPRNEYFYFHNGLEALRSGRWKLRTTTGEPELFDMVTDPAERINRAAGQPDQVAELLARMREMAREVGVPVAGDTDSGE